MNQGTAYNPWEEAERRGITVVHRTLRTANGLWVPEVRTIVLRPRLRRVHERSILTHELGHADYGHTDDRPKHELQADRWALTRLILPAELERASRLSDDPGAWCHELQVSARLLRLYFAEHQPRAA